MNDDTPCPHDGACRHSKALEWIENNVITAIVADDLNWMSGITLVARALSETAEKVATEFKEGDIVAVRCDVRPTARASSTTRTWQTIACLRPMRWSRRGSGAAGAPSGTRGHAHTRGRGVSSRGHLRRYLNRRPLTRREEPEVYPSRTNRASPFRDIEA